LFDPGAWRAGAKALSGANFTPWKMDLLNTAMRVLLLSLLTALPLLAQAVVYYVSPNGSDTNNGTSTSTPWRTIDRVNQLGTGITAGTQILFERGGTYRGRININGSGTAANKIVIGAYGTGADPVISGSVLVTAWTQHSGAIWKATVSQFVKQVYFNGARMELARFPNQGQWLFTDAHTGTTTTDSDLAGSGTHTGATLVIRTTNWSYDTAFVSAQSGNTLAHTGTGNNVGAQTWGYFLRNKLSMLDAPGEWFYDRATSTLYAMFPGGVAPTGNTIEAAHQDFGIYFGYQRRHARVLNLTFRHQTDASVRLSVTDNLEVAFCTMEDTYRAIYSTGSVQDFHDNTVRRTLTTAVFLIDNNSRFVGNTITDACLWPGWGESNWGYFGLRVNGTGMVVTDNRIENIGYIGIAAYTNTLIERNVVKNCLAILNDGGGIAIDNTDGMIIRDNIVRDIGGVFTTTAPQIQAYFQIGYGIYFGNITTKNTLVEGNTVTDCSTAGIYVDHTMLSSGNIIRNNTLFNNRKYQLSISDHSNYNTPGGSPPYFVPSFNTIYSGNIMYSLTREQNCMLQTHVYGATLVDYGTFSNNRYFNPYNELSIQIHHFAPGTREFFSMERFAAQFNEDAGSTRHPLRQDIYATVSELSGNLVTNGTFATDASGWTGWPYNGTLTRDLAYLDNGALKAYLPNASQYATFMNRSSNYFSIQNGQWYRLRFSLQSNIHGNLNAGVKGQSQLVNTNVIDARDVPFDNQRRDLEWHFQANISDPSMIQFIHSFTQPQYWVDNVELHRVTVTPIDPNDMHKIYVNETAAAQTYTLPSGCWKNVEGVTQGATITVQPYKSIIVYRFTGPGCSTQQVDCQGVTGGSALPGTACNDGNPCTVNDTWNSSCQCVGTASGLAATVTPSGSTTLCTGGSVVLSANTGTGFTYAWKRNGTVISGATSPTYTANQAGTYTVDVTSNGCTTTSAGVVVTVNAVPSAVITAGGATTFCAGGSVSLSASTGTGYTYQWRNNGVNISGATASTYSATATGSYTVVVTANGCSATSAATAVTVNAGPTAAISAGGPTGFCTGGSVVLSATTGTGYAYQWRRDGANISGATASTFTAAQAGTYTVQVTANGCSAISSGIPVTVGTTPSATVTAGGPTTFCSGGSVTLSAATGTGFTYQWRRNGTDISVATASTYSATAAGTYTVVVNNGGCTATSGGTVVTVNAAPSATITAGGATSFCAGGSVTLSANSGTGLTYQWRNNGTAISGATASTYTATASGSYTVVVTSNGCSTTSAATAVAVTSAPAATITAGGPTTFCSGGSVALSANTGTGLTYQWRLNGNAISGATASTYTASAAGTYTVVVANGGCSTTSAGTTVAVNAAPSATITAGGATAFCTGGSVVLSANTGTGFTYQWRNNGTGISGATASSYTATASGTYTVVVTANGCSTTSTGTTVAVSSAPTATITAGGATTFCSGGSVTLNANSGTGLTHQWRLNGSAISGATASSYTASAAGTYTVVVSNAGCSATSAGTVVTVNARPTVACSANAAAATVTVSASGGQAPYSYAWSTSPVQSTATATVSASGAYTATVTGANGCSASCSTTITLAPPTCAGIRTETQGLWGQAPTATNVAGYLNTNWAAAFPAPNGLTVGCTGRLVRFTSQAAVDATLPTTGTAALLPAGTTVNPGNTISNTLLGHLVALKISARMDELDPAFAAPTVLLRNMIIASGTFGGWTVQQLIDHADQAIGGCVAQYPLVTIASAIANINNGYQGGTMSNGYLVCPGSALALEPTDAADDLLGEAASLVAYPNPLANSAVLMATGLKAGERVVADVYALDGAHVESIANGLVPSDGTLRMEWHAADRAAGMYFCRLVAGEQALSVKLMVER
jgi:parallel beta-helix repeat protein